MDSQVVSDPSKMSSGKHNARVQDVKQCDIGNQDILTDIVINQQDHQCIMSDAHISLNDTEQFTGTRKQVDNFKVPDKSADELLSGQMIEPGGLANVGLNVDGETNESGVPVDDQTTEQDIGARGSLRTSLEGAPGYTDARIPEVQPPSYINEDGVDRANDLQNMTDAIKRTKAEIGTQTSIKPGTGPRTISTKITLRHTYEVPKDTSGPIRDSEIYARIEEPNDVTRVPTGTPRKKSRSNRPVIIGVTSVVVLLVAGAAVALVMFVLKPGDPDDSEPRPMHRKFDIRFTAQGLKSSGDITDAEVREWSRDLCTETINRVKTDVTVTAVFDGCVVESITDTGNGNVEMVFSILTDKHDRIKTDISYTVEMLIVGKTDSGGEDMFGPFRIMDSNISVTKAHRDTTVDTKYMPFGMECSISKGDVCIAPPSECIDNVCTCNDTAFYDVNKDECVDPAISISKVSNVPLLGQDFHITCSLTMKAWKRIALVKESATPTTPCVDGETVIDVLQTSGGFRNFTKTGFTATSQLTATSAILNINFGPLECHNKGRYMCIATNSDFCNYELSSDTDVNVTSQPELPVLVAPTWIYPSYQYEVTCEADTGLQPDGNTAGVLSLEIKYEDGRRSVVNGTESVLVSDQCKYHQTLNYTFTATTEWKNIQLSCLVTLNSGKILKSQSKTLTLVESQGVYFLNTYYSAVLGDMVTLTCAVDNVHNLTQIQIVRGAIHREIATLTHASNHVSIEGVVIVTSNIEAHAGRLGVRIDQTSCADDDVYFCKAAGYTANTTLSLKRAPEIPVLTLSYQIIDTKSTWQDKMFTCNGQLGIPLRTLDVEGNKTGQFVSIFNGGSDLAYVFGQTNSSADCGYLVNIKFDFHRINMDLHGLFIRCVVRPAPGETQTYVSEPQEIKVLPIDFCEGHNFKDIPHKYSCTSYVYCRDSGNIGDVKQCPEGSCFSPVSLQCMSCSDSDCVIGS